MKATPKFISQEFKFEGYTVIWKREKKMVVQNGMPREHTHNVTVIAEGFKPLSFSCGWTPGVIGSIKCIEWFNKTFALQAI